MKVFVFLLFVAVATASPAPEYEVALLRNSLDELVRQTFEYVRWLLQRHEPYDFPPLPEMQLVDTDINIKFSSSGVKLSKAEDFTVDKISNDLVHLKSSFGVTIPRAHLEGNYVLTGTVLKKNVQGSGTFSVDLDKFVQTGDVQNTIIDHSLQIQDLTLDYQLGGVKFDVEGLNIEGVAKDQVEDFLNKSFNDYLQQHKAEVVQKVSERAKARINQQLKGHSLQDVIAWLKQIVASTPDPPPFPFIQ